MISTDYTISCGELFATSDEKLVISRDHNNNFVKKANRKFDIIELSSGLLEQSITLDNEDGTGLDNIQCSSSKLLSITRAAGGYSFHGFEFSKCRIIPKQLLKQRVGKEPCPQMVAARDSDNMFFLFSSGSPMLWAALMTSDNIQVLSTPIRLDSPGVFPESFDKKKLPASGNGYTGGIKAVVCHPTKQFIFVVWGGGMIQVWAYSNLRKALLQKSGSADATNAVNSNDDGEEAEEEVNDGASSVGTSDMATRNLKKRQSVWGSKAVVNALLIPKAIFKAPEVVANDPKAGVGAGQGNSNLSSTPSHPQIVCDHSGQLAAVIWGESNGGLCVYDIRSGAILGGHGADNSTITASNITVLQPAGTFMKFPDGWKPSFVCFHPSQPVLLNIVQRPTMQGCPAIWCHTLLEPGLRILGLQGLDVIASSSGSVVSIDPLRYSLHSMTTASYGGKIVLVWKDMKSNANGEVSLQADDWTRSRQKHVVVVAHLSSFWTSLYSCQSTLATSISTPPIVFLEGDKSLMKIAQTAEVAAKSGNQGTANYNPAMWPSMMVVNVNSKVSELGLRPISHNFNIFNMSFASSSVHKDAMKFVGSFGNVAHKTSSEIFNNEGEGESKQSFVKLNSSDAMLALHRDGPFIPNCIHVQDLGPVEGAAASAGLESDVIIIGASFAPRLLEVKNADGTVSIVKTPTLDRCPALTVLRVSRDGSNGVVRDSGMLSAIDACFWDRRPSNVLQTAGSAGDILLVSSTGQQVVLLAQRADKSGYESAESWILPAPVIKLSASPKGTPQCIVYATAPPGISMANGTANFSTFDQSSTSTNSSAINRQKLVISNPDSIVFPVDRPAQEFVLEEGELVLEMKWQPVGEAMWNNCTYTSTSAEFRPLFGVLTTNRSMIFAVEPALRLLAQFRPAKREITPITRLPSEFSLASSSASHPIESIDRILSIAWVGLTLLFTCVSGKVGFLLPSSPLLHLADIGRGSAMGGDMQIARGFKLSQHLLLHEKLHLAGLRADEFEHGVLCHLPRQLLSTESCKILAVLPDRIIFASQQLAFTESHMVNMGAYDRYTPTLRVFVRPVCVAEPLLLGLLSSSAVLSSAQLLPWSEAILQIVTRYFLLVSDSNTNSNDAGAIQNAHFTSKLCLSLCFLANRIAEASLDNTAFAKLLFSIVAVISGCSPMGLDARSEFPKAQWIPSELKFAFGMKDSTRNVISICADMLSNKPELLEILLDPEAYCSSLPHPRSPLALQCVSAARYLYQQGHANEAKLLADIAGDDLLIVSLLLAEGDGSVSADRQSDLQTLADCLPDNYPLLHDILDQYLKAKSQTELTVAKKNIEFMQTNNPFGPYPTRITRKSLGCSGRRTGMHLLSKPLLSSNTNSTLAISPPSFLEPGKELPWLKATAINPSNGGLLGFIAGQQRSAHVSRGGGLGPTTVLGVLAADSIDDWVGGKMFPEVVVVSEESMGGLAALQKKAAMAAGKASKESEKNDWEATVDGTATQSRGKPIAWTSGVGEGKDWEKVVGYWRFSDAVKPGHPLFVTSGAPHARMLLLDLSKYGACSGGTAQALELFCPRPSSLALELSSSPVDPGEDHEKVKALYDVNVLESPPLPLPSAGTDEAVTQGLRVVIGRGSPLDIGLCHAAAERSRMTVECWVKFDSQSKSSAPQKLLMRTRGGPSGCVGGEGLFVDAEEESKYLSLTKDVIWCLFVDEDSKLCWAFGDLKGKNVLRSSSRCNALTESSQWAHIAVTVDSSNSAESGSNSSNAWAAVSNVNAYVNGELVLSESTNLPTFAEFDLIVSTLYIVPNASSGWSITELRIWADIRSAHDIDSQKENHLALASKRKRLQNRIKGGKKMFSALVASSLVVGEPAESLTPLATILKKLTSQGDEDEQAESSSAVSSTPAASGLKAPSAAKLGGPGLGLAPAAGPAAARRASLLPPKPIGPASAAIAVHSNELELEPAASSDDKKSLPISKTGGTGGLAPPSVAAPASSAGQGGGGGGGGGLLAGPGGSSGLSAAARARRASMATSTAAATTVDANESPISKTSESQVPKPVTSLPAAATSVSTTTTAKAPVAQGVSSTGEHSILSVVNRLGEQLQQIYNVSIDVQQLLKQVNSKPLQHFGCVSSIVRDASWASDTSDGSKTTIFKPCSRVGDLVLLAPLHHEHMYLELPIRAESVLVNNFCLPSITNPSTVIDVVVVTLLRNEIVVYASSANCLKMASSMEERLFHRIATQAATPIAFWSFVGPDSLLIIGPKAVYSWKLKIRDEISGQFVSSNPFKPNKLFERLDILPHIGVSNWERIRILDAVIADGWMAITSSICADNATSSMAYNIEQSLVTVVHMKSGKYGVFEAYSGLLLPHGLLGLVVPREANASEKDIVVYELDKLPWSAEPAACTRWSVDAFEVASKWRVPSASCSHPGDEYIASTATSVIPRGFLACYGEYVFTCPTHSHGQVCVYQLQTGALLLCTALNEVVSPTVSSDGVVIVSGMLDSRHAQQPQIVLLLADGCLHRIELSKLVRRAAKK